jgi:hypothetical protein
MRNGSLSRGSGFWCGGEKRAAEKKKNGDHETRVTSDEKKQVTSNDRTNKAHKLNKAKY